MHVGPGHIVGGGGVAGVGAPQPPQQGNGNIQQAPGLFSMTTLNKLVENVLGGTIHTLSNVMRGIDLYTQLEISARTDEPEPDIDEISRTTVVGTLPNPPGFASAIEHNKQALSNQFVSAMNRQDFSQQARGVLALLDGVNLDNLQRGGQGLALSRQQFHSALMHGCHFVVNDNGQLYDRLRQTGGNDMQPRGSSHYKSSPHQQYGMDLPGEIGHLLIGRTDTGQTFFQLESHGVGNGVQGAWNKFKDFAGHMQSWAMHIGSSSAYVQIGPHGAIEGSEKDQNHVVIN